MESSVKYSYFSSLNAQSGRHHHNSHQIIFIKRGGVLVNIEGVTRSAKANDILIFCRHENHSVEAVTDFYERHVLEISPDLTQKGGREFSLLLNRPAEFSNIISVERDEVKQIDAVFKSIAFEKSLGAKLFCEKMLENLVSQLLILLCRECPAVLSKLDERDFDRIFALQKFLETNCEQNFTLEGLAQSAHVSVSTLEHKFKSLTGFSIFTYLLRCRVANAKNLLATTNFSIGEIVEKCGFTDSSNFARYFKKEVGMTPSKFRKIYSEM